MWESDLFEVINLPFRMVSTLLFLVLTPIYVVFQFLVLPLLIILFGLSLIWAVVMFIILGCSKVSMKYKVLRPISFLIALPFLLVGDFFDNNLTMSYP